MDDWGFLRCELCVETKQLFCEQNLITIQQLDDNGNFPLVLCQNNL